MPASGSGTGRKAAPRSTGGCPAACCLPNTRGEWRRRLPTPLLEMGWAGLLLLGATALWDSRPFPGALFLYLVGGYGAGRFLLEPTREAPERVAGVMLHQAISAALLVLSVVAFVSIAR